LKHLLEVCCHVCKGHRRQAALARPQTPIEVTWIPLGRLHEVLIPLLCILTFLGPDELTVLL
jgi:hypothetical protein